MTIKLYQGRKNGELLTEGQKLRNPVYKNLPAFSMINLKKRDSFCFANSLFLAAAYFNKVSATEGGYRNFMRLMFVSGYIDPATGFLNTSATQIASQMGLAITVYKGEEAQAKYNEIMKGEPGTAYMILSKGHWVFGVTGGDDVDSQFNFDTSAGPASGPQKRNRKKIEAVDVEVIEIIKPKE